MWMVPPEFLCNSHLLGEHVEIHMLAGALRLGHSIKGYCEKRIVEPKSMVERHQSLVAEMERRGMAHKSPLNMRAPKNFDDIEVDRSASLAELRHRCAACRIRSA